MKAFVFLAIGLIIFVMISVISIPQASLAVIAYTLGGIVTGLIK